MPGPTPYLEANAILAAQERDEKQLYDILRQMLPAELKKLAGAAEYLTIGIAAELGVRKADVSTDRTLIDGRG